MVENVNIFAFLGFKFIGENLIIEAFHWFSVIIQHHLVLLKLTHNFIQKLVNAVVAFVTGVQRSLKKADTFEFLCF